MTKFKKLSYAAIFLTAIGGATVSNANAKSKPFTDAYPSNDCSNPVTKPSNCGTTGSVTCTVNSVTYYQKINCVDRFTFN